ncbi:MAG: NAD(P)/FAD-dependent oxidoreductase [Candidatus Heimdallarchaeota archaeon]
MDEYKCEVLIIGAGPAGLTAGVYCGRANRDTIILEGKEPSALVKAKEIQNWIGERDTSGSDLLKKFKSHAESFDHVRIIEGDVISLMIGMGANMISTRTANITSDAVIIATGTGKRKEIIKGESSLIGFGISYCALCDGPLYKDREVYLYGSDAEMLEDALILKQMGCKVHIITNLGVGELPEKVEEVKQSKIDILDNTEIIEAISDSDGIIQKITVKPINKEEIGEEDIKEIELDCLFILSHVPSNSIFKKAGIELDEKGNVKIDDNQQTHVKGVYAAGDVTGGLFQVVFAAAEGARAGINACKFLRQLKKG